MSELVMMSNWRTYLLPLCYASVLHLVVFLAFFTVWEKPAELVIAPPVIIKASLVAEDPIAAQRKAKQQQLEKQRQQRIVAEKKRKELAKKRAAEEKRRQAEALKKKRAEEAKAQKLAEEKKRQAQEAAELAEKQRREEALAKQLEQERLQSESDLLSALNLEEEQLQGEADAQAVASYEQYIQQKIVSNWSRPASARLGMKAVLIINLLPTGEVNTTNISRSSGDAAFDRSAIQAVQRAAPFTELTKLSPRLFDAKFRRFSLTFRPEDLDR